MGYRAKKVYQDKNVVSTYDQQRFESLKGYFTHKRELSLIYKALHYASIIPPATLTVLDTPCGSGRLTSYLVQKGFDVKGLDISFQMVRYTKEKLTQCNVRDKGIVCQGDTEYLPFQDNTFEACISLRLFGHTPPNVRKAILHELKRASKKYLILAYYNKHCLQHFLRKGQRLKKQIEWHAVTFKQIHQELEEAGLEKIKYFSLLPGISETVVVLARKK